jgi:hypothetical protein
MNVCCICGADGVAEVLGSWYCVDHVEDGFMDLALFLARLRGWDEGEVSDAIGAWLES